MSLRKKLRQPAEETADGAETIQSPDTVIVEKTVEAKPKKKRKSKKAKPKKKRKSKKAKDGA